MFARYPLVKQNDQSDCGAASLASVALHYRMPVALHRMRTLAGTDREGTNLLGLVEAAEKLGFSAKAAKGTSDSLGDIPLPAIAHVKNNEALGHFVVLYRVSARWVTIADPAGGVEKIALGRILGEVDRLLAAARSGFFPSTNGGWSKTATSAASPDWIGSILSFHSSRSFDLRGVDDLVGNFDVLLCATPRGLGARPWRNASSERVGSWNGVHRSFSNAVRIAEEVFVGSHWAPRRFWPSSRGTPDICCCCR